jgi:hypothetical protein
MENKEKTQENKFSFPWEKEEHKQFAYGDLFVWCRNCGSDSATNKKNIQTALVTQTNVDNKDVLALGCPVCGSQIVLHFKESVNPPLEDEKQNTDWSTLEQVLEETKEEKE